MNDADLAITRRGATGRSRRQVDPRHRLAPDRLVEAYGSGHQGAARLAAPRPRCPRPLPLAVNPCVADRQMPPVSSSPRVRQPEPPGKMRSAISVAGAPRPNPLGQTRATSSRAAEGASAVLRAARALERPSRVLSPADLLRTGRDAGRAAMFRTERDVQDGPGSPHDASRPTRRRRPRSGLDRISQGVLLTK